MPSQNRQKSGSHGGWVLWLVAVLWSFPCIAFLIDAPEGVRVKAGLAVFALSIVLAAIDRKSVVLGMPFAAMLAPISGTTPFGIEGLLLSDAFLGMAFCAFLAGAVNPNFRIRVGSECKLLFLVFGLSLFSWAAAVEPKVAINGVLNIVAMGILYLVTASLVTSEKVGKLVIWSWVIAAFYGAILTVVSYTQATPLLLGSESIGGQQYAIDMLSSDLFFRATYFYAGFFFVIGAASIVLLVCAMKGKSALMKLAATFGLLLALSVLFLMGNKTAMVGFVILAIAIGWRSFCVGSMTTRIARIATLAFALVVTSLGVAYASFMIIGEDQWLIALERIGNMESLETRLQIFEGALKQLLSSPKMFLVGIGPDMTVRMGDSGYAAIDSLLINPATGIVEGAIDSTYLTVLVEYGVPFGALLFAFTIKTITMLHCASRQTDENDLLLKSLMAIVLWWMVVALGQTSGTSKPTWLIVQIIATAYGVYSTGKETRNIVSMRQACTQTVMTRVVSG